ncbi:MAG: hypothetical protein AVDCRST_MAG51-3242, partial [uncultured Ramlibacter sp.]
EAASLHEVLIEPLRDAFNLGGFLWFGWVIVGAVFVLVFSMSYLRFLAHLPARSRWLFLLSGAMYVTGALVLEMVGAWVYLAGEPTQELLAYMVVMTLEESLEMTGILLFNLALTDYLGRYCPPLSLEVPSGSGGWRLRPWRQAAGSAGHGAKAV